MDYTGKTLFIPPSIRFGLNRAVGEVLGYSHFVEQRFRASGWEAVYPNDAHHPNPKQYLMAMPDFCADHNAIRPLLAEVVRQGKQEQAAADLMILLTWEDAGSIAEDIFKAGWDLIAAPTIMVVVACLSALGALPRERSWGNIQELIDVIGQGVS